MRPRREMKGNDLHRSTSFENQGPGLLVTQSGPQDTGGTPRSGYTGDAGWLGLGELMIVASQDWLVQTQGIEGIHQGPAQVDVADLDDALAFAFALTDARVVTTTHQATATEDLGLSLIHI